MKSKPNHPLPGPLSRRKTIEKGKSEKSAKTGTTPGPWFRPDSGWMAKTGKTDRGGFKW